MAITELWREYDYTIPVLATEKVGPIAISLRWFDGEEAVTPLFTTGIAVDQYDLMVTPEIVEQWIEDQTGPAWQLAQFLDELVTLLTFGPGVRTEIVPDVLWLRWEFDGGTMLFELVWYEQAVGGGPWLDETVPLNINDPFVTPANTAQMIQDKATLYAAMIANRDAIDAALESDQTTRVQVVGGA